LQSHASQSKRKHQPSPSAVVQRLGPAAMMTD
jgi:hypothetical protein